MGRIKLYNHSRMEDKPLYALLQAAAVAAGVKGPVVVKIGRGGERGRCYADRAFAVARSFLAKRQCLKPRTKADREWGTAYKQGWVKTNRGYVVISPRWDYNWRSEHGRIMDGLAVVLRLWDTAIHEFTHVRDFQLQRSFIVERVGLEFSRAKNGRRPIWEDRPEEQRAMKAVKAANRVLDRKSQAKRRAKIDEIKLALAIHIEEVYNK